MKRNAVPKRPIDQVAYPDALEQAEAKLVGTRRQKAGFDPPASAPTQLPEDTVGIGLSGGGVRSATFSLGVFQALARGECLHRIDFLSTVSGGGYFGSFLGRLFTREWVSEGMDLDVELLQLVRSSHFGGTRLGRYLHELRARFPGPVVADMFCLLQLDLELAIRAKGMLMAREAGLEVPRDPDLQAKLAERVYLHKAIGNTGMLALRPLQVTSDRDDWHQYLLRNA